MKELDYFETCSFAWEKSVAKSSALYFWNLIENSFCSDVFYLRQIFRASHSLPTSSAGIESSFSRMKLIKNNSRTSLKEETLQSLLLIFQEFEGKEEILISEKLLKACKKPKKL